MQVTKRDGSLESADKKKIFRCVERAAKGLADVDAHRVTDEAYAQLHDGIGTAEIDRATVLSARARIVEEPNYSYLAARLLLHGLYREAFGKRVDHRSLTRDYREAFLANLKTLVEAGQLNPDLLRKFNLARLANALCPERDLGFKYLGLQTLYDRYFLHLEGRRLETPQAWWLRVAMGLSLGEDDSTAAALEAYEVFSTFRSSPATPTLLNSGTIRPQLSSCFLSTMEDSIDGIYGTLHGQARLSKHGGGLGVDVTPLRGLGARIGRRGTSGGIVPWARQYNDLVVAVNQEGVRKGAAALYLEPWHVDYPDFLELLKNTGDERRRCHDLHTASWIPDEFMRRVKDNQDWYFFSPDDCPDLHDAFGEEFTRLYRGYVKLARRGEIKNFRVQKAKDAWRKMLTALRETGHPWMTFKDPSNIRYPNGHKGVVHSSNLCTEIMLHTLATRWREQEAEQVGETAVCNLHSVNVASHADDQGSIDWSRLADTVKKDVRYLDNAIPQGYLPTKEARQSNLMHRPVGLGLMGWTDLLHKKKIVQGSAEDVLLSGEVMEFISWHAILASAKLARERGTYPSYQGSLWSKGKLPVDTWADLMEYRTGARPADPSRMDWRPVREAVAEHGMRNSLVMAIAPTVTISSIAGCSPSVDPGYSVLYVNSTLSGEFAVVNESFVAELKTRGLWGPEAVEQLQQADGDVKKMFLPPDLQERFQTAFDVDQKGLIRAAAARQVWIDQGHSLNLFYAGDSMKGMSDLYFFAWEMGLKSTYYLHTKAASRVEKAAVEAVPGKTCVIGEACEACQ